MNPAQFAQDLARGRAELEAFATARMESLSRCTIRRKTGASTVVGGFKVPTWTLVYTNLPVRVSGANSGSAQSRTVNAGGVDVTVPVRVASFPIGTVVRDGDMVEITSGDTEGLVLRVVEADPQDQATARRVSVIGTTRPEEWT